MSRTLQTPEFDLKLELDGTVNDRLEYKYKTQPLIEAVEQEKINREKAEKEAKAEEEAKKKAEEEAKKKAEAEKIKSNRTKGYYLSEENHKWLAKEALRLSLDGDDRVTASSLLEEIINKYRGKSV